MGTVSTSLSEEELSKCIKTSVFESVHLEKERTGCNSGADDSKCSICQEEFVRGDKIGSLKCGHGYHTPCISQWLQLKNWCPICKASPKPSSSSSPAWKVRWIKGCFWLQEKEGDIEPQFTRPCTTCIHAQYEKLGLMHV
ncbi:E3 ubiquitin protein ligase MBR2-like protein isoform X1 [Tanacetum coccineum]